MTFDGAADPAQVAIDETEELFRVLTEERGLSSFDAIAGMHGEIVRQMLIHFGFPEAEHYLGLSLSTIVGLADAEAADPLSRLLHAEPAGSA